jgi:sugar lactone lactonase YvrE
MQSMKIALENSPKSSKSRLRWMQALCCMPALGTLLLASPGSAAVPAVVSDAQQTIATNFSNTQSIAVAPNGVVYVADTNNNRIVELTPNLPATSTPTYLTFPALKPALSGPTAVAVDASGNLYITDTPGSSVRILQVAASNGAISTSSTATSLYSGNALTNPISLAISSAGTLFIGNAGFPGAIYTMPAAVATPKALTITGISGTFTPAALAVSGSNLFIANSSSINNGVYVAPTAGGAAKSVLMGSFVTQQPQGLAVDASGDLFVLAQLAVGPNGNQVLEIPNASAVNQSTPYIIPSNNLVGNGDLALDPEGNVDVVGYTTGFFSFTGSVTQLNSQNPVYFGATSVTGFGGSSILFNFEFNQTTKLTGFRAVTVGDLGSNPDIAQVRFNGTCGTGSSHTVTTATQPYTCYQYFQATPEYAGTRISAIQVEGSSATTIIDSSPVYELGQAGAQIAYPLDTNQTNLGLTQPQGITVSGFDQTVYIADLIAGKVSSMSSLNGSKATPVSTGSITLSAPSAVAMNGEGDLFIADFNLGEVVVVPTTTGVNPYVLNTGGLLQHPIALTTDELGDLYIGDAGPDGDDATSSQPGYVVVVPYSGSPFQLSINGASIIFPQALAYNNATGVLAIGDGGDISNSIGQIVEVSSNGPAQVVSYNNPAPDPSGLVFDAAGNLYVLDGNAGTAGTFSVVYTDGTSASLSIANPSALFAPSALANSAGSQSFVIANLGGGTSNNLVYLNGNSASLSFANQTVGTTSASQQVTVANIGNQTLTLNTNYYSPKPIPGFTLGSGTCAGGSKLTVLSTCTLAFAFSPSSAVTVKTAVTVNSNAYNSGTPVINLSGTGTAQANVVKFQPNVLTLQSLLQPKRVGRKSFASAKFRK